MNGPTCVKGTPVLPSMWDILYIISDDSPMLEASVKFEGGRVIE